MMHLGRTKHAARRLLFGRHFELWYHREYRLPLSTFGGATTFDPRRADFTAWYLADAWLLDSSIVRRPTPVRYREMALVHTQHYLESLTERSTLARIFAVNEGEVVTDHLLHTIRLATGGTVQATRSLMRHGRGTALNLFGGFHHAAPATGGGFCAVNDIAIAIADARNNGCNGTIGVLDLDAHPPDGTAACLVDDGSVWIGSLSAERWSEPLPNVDETVLPTGCSDDEYLAALRGLLSRMPKLHLAFVLAGGDIVRGDRLGKLDVSEQGVRRRDMMVHEALRRVPSVWLPGGGYSRNAWRILAGTAAVLAARATTTIPVDYDPMRARFSLLARKLTPDLLQDDSSLDLGDIEEVLGIRPSRVTRVFDTYTKESIEHALSHYGVLGHITRLGYEQLEVELGHDDLGESIRLFGTAFGKRHKLIETILQRTKLQGRDVLYIHWLQLRNPRANFHRSRPKLPGQDAPGLGLAHEVGWILARMARRIGMDGVAYRPAWYHTGYSGRRHFWFVDRERHARFLALMRDSASLPLLHVTNAAAQGRLCLDGKPYTWEADEMVFWLDEEPPSPESYRELVNKYVFSIPPVGQKGTADCNGDQPASVDESEDSPPSRTT